MSAEPVGLPTVPGIDMILGLVADAYALTGRPGARVTPFPDLGDGYPVTVVQGPVSTILTPVDVYRAGAAVRSETVWQVDVYQDTVDPVTGLYAVDDGLASDLAVCIPATRVNAGQGRAVHWVTVTGPTRFPAGPADGDKVRDFLTVTITEMVGTPAP